MWRSIVVLSLLVIGCNRNNAASEPGKDPDVQDQAGTTNLTGALWLSNDTAIERIVTARCAREVTCSNLGPDKHFETSDKCVQEVTAHYKEDLRGDACSHGVDGDALDHCLSAIKSESCTNPLDAVARLNDCRAGKLCLHAAR